jgi:hypothetical protein
MSHEAIFSITIYSNIADKPEVIGFRARIKDDAGKMSVLRSDVEGMLHVEGSAVTLKTDKEVLPIQVSERTRIYEAVPAKREDIKVGANAMLEVKYLEGKPTVKMIGFMPAGN